MMSPPNPPLPSSETAPVAVSQASLLHVQAETGGLFRHLCAGKLALDDVWLLMPLLMLFVIVAIKPIHPADFWWHLRTGQIIVETGSVPTTDLFTFTRFGQPWTNQAWLMQVIYFVLFQAGGLPLILFVHALTIVLGYAFIELACLEGHGVRSRDAALGTVAAMAMGLFNWNIRPQSVSFLCFGFLVYAIERHRRRGGRIIWWLPVLFAVWGNLHGGVVFGLILLGIYVVTRLVPDWLAHRPVGRDGWSLVWASLLAVLGLALNPRGLTGMFSYFTGFLASSPTLRNNIEFQPLSIRAVDGALVTGVFLLLFIVIWQRRTFVLAPYHGLAAVVFGASTLYARRMAPWLGMAVGPAVATLLAAAAPATTPSKPGKAQLNLALVGGVLLLDLLALPWLRPYLPALRLRSYVVAEATPAKAAVVFCELGPDVRAFAEIFIASYLVWVCPSTPVFMDTRFELYTPELWEDYIQTTRARYDWRNRLQRYGIDLIFSYNKDDQPLVDAARASGEWDTLYADENSVLMRLRTSLD